MLTFECAGRGARNGFSDFTIKNDTMIALATRSLFAFWPGATKAWNRADTSSFWIAIGFSWSFCLAVATIFLWEEWLHAWIRFSLCFILGASSCISGARLLLIGESLPVDSRVARDARFQQAQAAYLQGDYFESERLLASNLALEDADLESGLLLVSVLRRSGRYEEAIQQINHLRKRDFSVRWESELAMEKEKCLKRKRQSMDAPPPKAT